MQVSARAEAFDRWIRGPFVVINTVLEEQYFRQEDRSRVEGIGDSLKAQLRDEGHVHIVGLLKEGNTGDGFQSAFNVLGNVGLYLAALRRHELTNPAREPSLIRNTLPFNVFGIPAISVPCGFTRLGLPIGLQIIGPRLGEARVLALADAYEQATDWHRREPPLA